MGWLDLDEDAAGWVLTVVWLSNVVLAFGTHATDLWAIVATCVGVLVVVLIGIAEQRHLTLWSTNIIALVFGAPLFAATLYGAHALGTTPGAAVAIATGSYLVLALVGVFMDVAERRPDGRIDWHLIPYVTRRRRPMYMWSRRRVLSAVRAAWLTSRADVLSVERDGPRPIRAIVVWHRQPRLLPSWVTQSDGFREYGVTEYRISPSAWRELGLSTPDDAGVVRSQDGFAALSAAMAAATDRATRRRLQRWPTDQIPKFLAAVLVADMRGRPRGQDVRAAPDPWGLDGHAFHRAWLRGRAR
jgi:hypothetical protein